MATGENRRKLYTGNDTVHDKLLSHVANHVIPTDREQFALQHLRMSDTKYEEIEHDNRGKSKAISFEVTNIRNFGEKTLYKFYNLKILLITVFRCSVESHLA